MIYGISALYSTTGDSKRINILSETMSDMRDILCIESRCFSIRIYVESINKSFDILTLMIILQLVVSSSMDVYIRDRNTLHHLHY